MNQSSSHILLTSKIYRERKKYILFHKVILKVVLSPLSIHKNMEHIVKPKLQKR